MSEIDLLRRMRGDQPAAAAALARARARLVSETRGGPVAMTRAVRPRPRLGWRLAATGVLSLVLASGVAVAVATAPSGDQPPTGGAAPDAATVLRSAALAAQQEPTLTARPDQFVYIETVYKGPRPTNSGTERVWRSVNGTRDGLRRWEQSGAPKTEEPIEGCVAAQRPGCTRYPGFKDDLPTDPDAMWQHLVKRAAADPVADEFTIAFWTIRQSYVPPASRSALFAAMARIPGISVVEGVKDAAGRSGLAVETGGHGLIFDPRTYAYLGNRHFTAAPRSIATASPPATPDGKMEGSACLKIAIVDRPGDLPK
ncbi:CU044_5270 family protein [Phytohabitans sp. LJ34]|uniref:CU044_5270 family protein n=1 Tax=Phytohabitans sp. LJ34 TaxID=3452217 RepID=UPI003F896B19